jgi:hypothetical protein
LSHCCIGPWHWGLQVRVRRDHVCVNHSSRGMVGAPVRHAELYNRYAFQNKASAGSRARVTSMATMYSSTRPLMLCNSCIEGG